MNTTRLADAGIENRDRAVIEEAHAQRPDRRRARVHRRAAGIVVGVGRWIGCGLSTPSPGTKTGCSNRFERYRPSEQAYSPLSFFFNFSHNVVKGTVVDALLWGEAWDVSLNDLLTGVPRAGLEPGSQQLLATTLMAYARSNPDRIRGKLMPVIVYDPQAGRRAFTVALEKLAQ